MNDPVAETERALRHPVGAPPLFESARGKSTACIVVSDITRPVPNKIILPPIIECLERSGMKPENIRILVATGIHRPPTRDELEEMLPEQVLARHSIHSHDARDATAIERLGFTRSGIPIDVNRLYLESNVKIVTGLVEPHFMAGYSGGRKSIAIGLTSVEAVALLHGPALLEHPGSRNCSLQANPLHAELVEIAEAAGADMNVSVVVDASRRVGKICAGGLARSHLDACRFAGRYATRCGSDLFDIVITTAAGYPLDTTYYQAVKGLVGALDILAPGGHIVLAAECSAGLGSADFRAGLRLLREIGDYDNFLEYIARPENFRIDQWEVEMLVKALRRATISVFSGGLPDSDWPLTRVGQIRSVEEGLRLSLQACGPAARMAIIPEGPYFIPTASDAEILEI